MRNIVTAKVPVRRLADLKGLKLRVVQGPVNLATYQALGANPVPMDFAEVPAAVTQGVIDGMDMPLTPTLNLKIFAYTKYYTFLRTYYESNVVLINMAFFKKLPPDLQQIVVKVASNSIAFERQQQSDDEAKAADALKANGMELINLPDEDIEHAKALAKEVYKKFEGKFNPQLLPALTAAN
jgi:TRAP-type C4-dicarboxylate transport system substrate-binding protein